MAGNIKVWDVAGTDLIEKGTYPIISGRINDIAWDADSQRIIAIGDGKERYGHCFTYDSGNTVGEISGHSSVVNAVSIRPVRPYRAATVSDDNSLVFYQGPPFKFSQSLRGHHGNFVNDVAFSIDGKYIVSVGADKKIVIYDGKTGDYIKSIENAHNGSIFSLSWIPIANKSNEFVTASADGSIKLWDVESSESLKTWSFEKELSNQQVGVVATNSEIISLSFNGNLNYFSYESESNSKPKIVIKGHQKSITSMTLSANGTLYSGSYDGLIAKWDKNGNASYIQGSEKHTNLIVGIVPSSSSNEVLATAAWDDTSKTIENGEFIDSNAIDSQPIDISSNSKTGTVAIITESTLLIYNSNKLSHTIKLDFKATSVGVSSNFIAVGSSDFNIYLYSIDSLSTIKKLPPLRSPASHLSFSDDGVYLAAGDNSGKITLYNVPELSIKTSRWAFHTGKVNSISWNPDGDHVVSGSLDTNLIIYSVLKPNKNIKFLGAHKDGVNSVKWVNEDTFVSGGSDATIKWWKVKY